MFPSIQTVISICFLKEEHLTILWLHLQVSLSGHLFDQFLINEALDIIEAAGGSFHLAKCQVGQSSKSISFSELEVKPLD